MLHKTLIAFAAAVALGCVPLATNALAAPPGHGHPGGHAVHARGGHVGAHYGGGYNGNNGYNGYNGYYGYSNGCPGYGYGNGYYGYNNGCPGYGVPLVGGVINGILGGYGPPF
jgi:hypothetical protein